MRPTPKPGWQRATALVSLGAGGVVTGLSFVPGSPADLTSPASLPFALMALEKSTQSPPSEDAMLRSAIVHVAQHYLRMAERKTPAQMEAIIWQHDSLDGADHGPSCAAFASLTLELGSHVIGQQSWVTGGTSYPWPMHAWADARVDANPASPQVVSIVQDAQAHHRWHPLGDGYEPQPGDWVLFDGHVEVVTELAGGVLHTIGGDSVPNFSVNTHDYPGPLGHRGVAGFVDNGLQPTGTAQPGAQAAAAQSGDQAVAGQSGGRAAAAQSGGQAAAAQSGRQAVAAQSGGQVAAPGVGDGQAPLPPGTELGPTSYAKQATRPAPASATPPAASAATAQEVLAPRAIPAVAPRYAMQSHARAASGAATSPAGGTSQPAGARPGTKDTARVVQQPQKPDHPRGHGAANGSQTPDLVHGRKSGRAAIPATGMPLAAAPAKARPGQAAIPGLLRRAHQGPRPAGGLAPYQRYQHAPSAGPAMPGTAGQRAFIEQIAPGAMATQQKYGVPASVTIAQAIDESGWGQSLLASHDHNLFGIKGSGPAGSDLLPTQEFIGGQLVDSTAPFRVYYNIGQSIEAHGKLLARSDYFTNAMANRHQPNAFAQALTGVYATDPSYGATLIGLMQHYDLYRFDAAAAPHATARTATRTARTATGTAAIPGITGYRGAGHENLAWPAAEVQPSRTAQHPAHPAPAPAAAVQSAPAPRQRRNGAATAPSAADSGRRTVERPRPADRTPGRFADSAHARPRSASSDPGRAPEAAIPGTGPDVCPAQQPGAGSRHATTPGQADIPGLPYPAAALTTHRARVGPRVRPAHPRPSAGRAAAAKPVTADRPNASHGGYAPPVPEPPVNASAAGQASSAAGHGGPGRVRQAATVGAATIPGLPAEGLWQVASVTSPPATSASFPSASGAPAPVPAAGPATNVAASLGDVAIPGLLPAAAALRGHAAHGPDAVTRGGTWIPGLPDAGQRVRHGADGARPGPAARRGRHGTDLAPTEARRIPSGTEPSAAAGHAAPSPRPAAPPTHGQGRPASAPAGAAGTTFGTAVPDPAPTDGSAVTAMTRVMAARYGRRLPPAVGKAFLTSAKVPLIRSESLYVDVAGQSGIPWQILAACDWMQCRAKNGLSPVYGEKLGALNPDGTSYRTRSAALERCSYDLAQLAWSVYQIDLTRSGALSVRELANVFAAFRWGGQLREHHTSAMEFPYSVEGLTQRHMHMRWPNIADPEAPDRPGTKFHRPFGALPIVLSLDYPATA